MRKNKQFLILILLSLYEISFAQLKDFNLSDYKLPDLKRKALETNFNLSGNNYYYNGTEKVGSNDYNSNVLVNYNHYLNSAKYQRESDFGLDFRSNFQNRKNNDKLLNKLSNFEPLLYFNIENRKYFQTNKFYETNLNLSYKYGKNTGYYRNDITNSESTDKLQTHSLLAYVPVKLGIGRIEQIQDARHAVYLFEELSKIDRVSSEKTDKEIIEFAALISQLKNKRFFDSRLRRISELESIDSFLLNHKYLLESDVKYFSTLADYWDFGNRPIRYSGTRFSGVILPGYYFYNYNNPGDGLSFYNGKYNLSALLLNSGFEFKHEKPINLLWQNSLDLNGYFGIIEGRLNDKSNSKNDVLRIPNVQLEFRQSIGFYPNTRTDVSFGYSVKYVQLFDKTDLDNEIFGVEGRGIKTSADLSVNYYISPKFRLNMASSVYYIRQDSKDNARINFEDIVGSNYLLSNFRSIINGFPDYYKKNEIVNSFRISLIYSVF